MHLHLSTLIINAWLSKDDELWKKYAKCIYFPSFIQGDIVLSDDEFMAITYDDFKDIR